MHKITCKKCGLEMTGTVYSTNTSKILWMHPGFKACKKVKPIK